MSKPTTPIEHKNKFSLFSISYEPNDYLGYAVNGYKKSLSYDGLSKHRLDVQVGSIVVVPSDAAEIIARVVSVKRTEKNSISSIIGVILGAREDLDSLKYKRGTLVELPPHSLAVVRDDGSASMFYAIYAMEDGMRECYESDDLENCSCDSLARGASRVLCWQRHQSKKCCAKACNCGTIFHNE